MHERGGRAYSTPMKHDLATLVGKSAVLPQLRQTRQHTDGDPFIRCSSAREKGKTVHLHYSRGARGSCRSPCCEIDDDQSVGDMTVCEHRLITEKKRLDEGDHGCGPHSACELFGVGISEILERQLRNQGGDRGSVGPGR
jgi:hypothetical protein